MRIVFQLLHSNKEDHEVSREIDLALGLESALKADSIANTGDPYANGQTEDAALYTDYQDFLLIKEDIEKRNLNSFIDCGAGNSRSKILFDLLSASFRSATLKYAMERVAAAQACCERLELLKQKDHGCSCSNLCSKLNG